MKKNMAPFLCYFKLCASFRSHLWLPTGVILPKSLHWGKICFNLCDPYLWLLTFYMDNTFVNSKNSWTFHYDTMTAQSLDTDVQRPFYSVATVALLPYGKRTTVATLNKKGVAYRYQTTVDDRNIVKKMWQADGRKGPFIELLGRS